MAIRLGTSGKNNLVGTRGLDTLYGLGNNDTLNGGVGSDTLSGGDGNDTLIGGAGPDRLHGGAGSDVFKYTLFKDAAGDSIVDFSSSDRIDFAAIGAHKFIGTARFNGVAGEIRYTYFSGSSDYDPYDPYGYSSSAYASVEIDSDGDALTDYSLRIDGDWRLKETAANSGILVAAAKQTLTGTAAANSLTGGRGDDTLSGLAGNDTLAGGEGKDRLLGGDGNDLLIGGRGTDTFTGGAGSDVFRFNSEDEIRSDRIADFASGDSVSVKIGGLSFVGDAPFRGKPGEYRFADGRIEFDFDGNRQVDGYVVLQGFVGQLQLSGSDSLVVAANLNRVGTGGNNTLSGGNGNDTLSGLAGNDTLNGGGGRDAMLGGDGNDLLNGGSGDDHLDGGSGTDVLTGGFGFDGLTGGAGNDTFKFNSLAEIGKGGWNSSLGTYPYDKITDLAVGDKIDLSAIAGLSFVGLGNDFTGRANEVRVVEDTWLGSSDGTTLEIDTDGDEETDYALAVLGDDVVIEETSAGSRMFRTVANQILNGNDTSQTLSGGNGHDTLNGLAGNDTLNGAYGDDTLNGGNGNDILTGGLGDDHLTGGAGNDHFKFNSLGDSNDEESYDQITDFATGDKIDLRAIDADTDLSGNQAFTFVGANSFTGIPGELRYTGADVFGDVNGDAIPDLVIQMGSWDSHPTTLNSADFFL